MGTTGQERDLPASARRSWTDLQMTSHVAFVPAIAISAFKLPDVAVDFGFQAGTLPELAALQSVVLGLSLLYHHNYERPGRLAGVEALCAKMLFVYGTAQTFYSPSDMLLVANSMCFLLTAGTFVITNLEKSLYERYHPIGLHVIPGDLYNFNI